MSQTSTKPYLVRAIFDWCVDNGFTPHIVVVVDKATRVPTAFVRDGQIVLNIAPYATHQLSITNEEVTCQARFGGVAHSLYVPMRNIIAVYARENGQGMAFEPGDEVGPGVELSGTTVRQEVPQKPSDTDDDSPEPPDDKPTAGRGGHLRVVK